MGQRFQPSPLKLCAIGQILPEPQSLIAGMVTPSQLPIPQDATENFLCVPGSALRAFYTVMESIRSHNPHQAL